MVSPEFSLTLYRRPIQCKEASLFGPSTGGVRLQWRAHSLDMKTWAIKRMTLLKFMTRMDCGNDRAIIIKVHHSIIWSKIDCGCLFHDPASDALLRLLDPIHNSTIHLYSGAFR